MPVSVVNRNGDVILFVRDNSDYKVDDNGTLHVIGGHKATFQAPAWSYVIEDDGKGWIEGYGADECARLRAESRNKYRK